jgi:hypothetical protein
MTWLRGLGFARPRPNAQDLVPSAATLSTLIAAPRRPRPLARGLREGREGTPTHGARLRGRFVHAISVLRVAASLHRRSLIADA